MNYPINLIKAYSAHKISRADFCTRLAELQGYDGTVKTYANGAGIFAEYRNRRALINGGVITWTENGKHYTAHNIKELKIKIDILEIKAAA